MRILKFTLSGPTAFFKKPEVNTYYSFTYGSIHKIALLGIFGSILGLGGYAQMKKEDTYPEFYEKLKHINVSVIPISENRHKGGKRRTANGYLSKKIQCFNNSVGYASKEAGGNLIVKEQWLEWPRWEIYLLLDCMEAEKIADSVLQRKSIYSPYLGKNDHPADIMNYEIFDNAVVKTKSDQIDSLFPKSWAAIDLDDDTDYPFKYEEMLPSALDSEKNLYQCESFVFTNMMITEAKCEIFFVNDKNIVFF